jgi:hypothetical protein
MNIASQFVGRLSMGDLDVALIIALVSVILFGKVALHLIKRYL